MSSVERQTQQVGPAGTGSAQQSAAGALSLSQVVAFTQSPGLCAASWTGDSTALFCGR